MIKLILGRVLPLGAAGFFLHSSVSPIKPALNAFAAAAEALTGADVDHVDANLPGVEGAPTPMPTPSSVKGGISGVIDGIFGDHHHEQAKSELDGIINDVKSRGRPPADPQPTPKKNAQQPAQAPGGRSKRK